MNLPTLPHTPPPGAPLRRSVLILGANGRIGAAATAAFAAAGWRVLAQARRPTARLPAGAQALPLALGDTAGLAAAAAGADALFYAVNPVYTRWAEELLPNARAAMDLASRLGARFLLPGNVYNYGRRLPARLSEDTPEHGDTPKARLRIELEAELTERARRGDLRSLVLRAGDFFGAGRGTWLDLAVVKDLPRGRLVYPGPLDRPHAWAYLPDLARTFVALAEQADLPDALRLHFPGHTLTGAELLGAIERAAEGLGLAPPAGGWRHAGMAWGLIRLAGWVWPMGRALAEMAYLWERPHALDGRALQARLGPLPTTPLDEALRRTLIDLGLAPSPGARPALA
jgi:nucleoside-diphosphate-sugar epimerase